MGVSDLEVGSQSPSENGQAPSFCNTWPAQCFKVYVLFGWSFCRSGKNRCNLVKQCTAQGFSMQADLLFDMCHMIRWQVISVFHKLIAVRSYQTICTTCIQDNGWPGTNAEIKSKVSICLLWIWILSAVGLQTSQKIVTGNLWSFRKYFGTHTIVANFPSEGSWCTNVICRLYMKKFCF